MERVKLLANTQSWCGSATTWLVWWPTVKLAELRTHRACIATGATCYEIEQADRSFCLNANSSRAVPYSLQRKQVDETPFVPLWTTQKTGMSGDAACEELARAATVDWLQFREYALETADRLNAKGIHKQDIGIVLNPFGYALCMLTFDSESLEHFLALRTGANVYPAVREIALQMQAIYLDSNNVSTWLEPGQWHIPFTYQVDTTDLKELLAVSVSQSALISFDKQDQQQSIQQHYNRALKLVSEQPPHVSTCEHQLQVPTVFEYETGCFNVSNVVVGGAKNPKIVQHKGKYFSPIKGYKQLRKLIECKEFRF